MAKVNVERVKALQKATSLLKISTLAEKCDCSERTISRVLAGENVTSGTLETLARVLRTTVAYLMSEGQPEEANADDRPIIAGFSPSLLHRGDSVCVHRPRRIEELKWVPGEDELSLTSYGEVDALWGNTATSFAYEAMQVRFARHKGALRRVFIVAGEFLSEITIQKLCLALLRHEQLGLQTRVIRAAEYAAVRELPVTADCYDVYHGKTRREVIFGQAGPANSGHGVSIRCTDDDLVTAALRDFNKLWHKAKNVPEWLAPILSTFYLETMRAMAVPQAAMIEAHVRTIEELRGERGS